VFGSEFKVLSNQMPKTVFFYYKMSEQRCSIIKHNLTDEPAAYCLYGARDLIKKGFRIEHNLEPDLVLGSFAHSLISHIDYYLHSWGRLWGNLETVLAHRKRANAADIVVATVDNVGIPIAFLKMIGFIHPPIIYVSIGLPEKIMNARGHFWICLCKRALRRMACVVAYGFEEALWLEKWLNGNESVVSVNFIPFGVDTKYFHPAQGKVSSHQVDVLSIGVDVQRDYPLLLAYAQQHTDTHVMIITNKEIARTLDPVPTNVKVLVDVPFSDIRGMFAGARVVALPIKENSYSGATTTLLQAMAMAKPIVVSRVGAIREGYGLRNGENCLLVNPGDVSGFGMAIDRLLSDGLLADKIGSGARTQVVSSLSWDNYVNGMVHVIEKTTVRPKIAAD
jgi:glycosyltransferase involved in cell wall biosynthesis